jgi:hypothetical protein
MPQYEFYCYAFEAEIVLRFCSNHQPARYPIRVRTNIAITLKTPADGRTDGASL